LFRVINYNNTDEFIYVGYGLINFKPTNVQQNTVANGISKILTQKQNVTTVLSKEFKFFLQFPGGTRTFCLCHSVQTSSGANSASSPTNDEALFTGAKRKGHQADESPVAEIKNAWSHTCTPPYDFIV
jgi:hypothetical protein